MPQRDPSPVKQHSPDEQPPPPPSPPTLQKETPIASRPTSVPRTKAITPPPPEEMKPHAVEPSTLTTETIVPISTAISDPQIFQRSSSPVSEYFSIHSSIEYARKSFFSRFKKHLH